MNTIDYSQFSTYLNCPLKWWERYVNKRVPKRPQQRDDAMCLGSLVHDGLQNWFAKGVPEISEDSILENDPTPDTLQTANFLLHAYIMRYPQEEMPYQNLEQPLIFDIGMPNWQGMAKIDRYFATNGQELVANEDGHTLWVEKGMWVMEHKTKSQAISRANYIQQWEVNRQASFQLLAMKKHYPDVRGIIINVIEKPRDYVPRRKCVGCGEYYELASFVPAEEGKSQCMVCGFVQKLNPYKPQKERVANFFRIKVTRTDDQLAEHLQEIMEVAKRMDSASELIANSLNCVHMQYGPCEYFNNHVYNVSTSDDPRMEVKDTTRYMGLNVL